MVQISNNTVGYKLHSISLQMFTWSFMAHADILRGGGQRDITLIMLHIIQQGDIPRITQGILFTHSNKEVIKNIFYHIKIEKKICKNHVTNICNVICSDFCKQT